MAELLFVGSPVWVIHAVVKEHFDQLSTERFFGMRKATQEIEERQTRRRILRIQIRNEF